MYIYSALSSLLSKATEMISRVLKSASPISIAENVLVSHYYCKNTLQNPCHFIYVSVLKEQNISEHRLLSKATE